MRGSGARNPRFESPYAASALAAASLAAAGSAAAAFLPFFVLRPNRIAQGRSIALVQAEPWILAALMVLWAAFLFLELRSSRRGAAIVSVSIVALALAATGLAAPRLAGVSHVARLSLGSGFWLLGLAAYASFVVASRGVGGSPESRRAWSFASSLALVIVLGLLLASGSLDSLSIVREWGAQRAVFAAQMRRHAALTAAAVIAGGLLGLSIGGAASRGKTAKSTGFLALNFFQTIPSLALFGLLILPLAALANRFPLLRSWGIGGIGVAPALIALSLYAALPIARNACAGLEGVPPAALDAGRGMGMGKAQLFLRVELPLALPVVVAGFRTATVQAIGNVAIAALIGAGGMGVFIFQGLGQFAMDMVLMGTLPVVAMALAADAAFGSLARALTPRGLRIAAIRAGDAP